MCDLNVRCTRIRTTLVWLWTNISLSPSPPSTPPPSLHFNLLPRPILPRGVRANIRSIMNSCGTHCELYRTRAIDCDIFTAPDSQNTFLRVLNNTHTHFYQSSSPIYLADSVNESGLENVLLILRCSQIYFFGAQEGWYMSNILDVKTIKTQVLSPRKGLYLIFYNAMLRVFL